MGNKRIHKVVLKIQLELAKSTSNLNKNPIETTIKGTKINLMVDITNDSLT